MIIDINHGSKIASLVMAVSAPKTEYDGISAKSQGNMQILPNGNILLGWGDHPEWSEYLPTGEPIAQYKMADYESHTMSYRTQKFEWVGEPLTSPKLWSFSRYGNSRKGQGSGQMAFHVSWNGATEVRQWAFYTSNNAKGPWKQVETAPKTSFETSVVVNNAAKWSYAEALDAEGNVLRKSNVAQTFVPSKELADIACTALACRIAPTEVDEQALSLAHTPFVSKPIPPFDPYQNFEDSALDRVSSFRQNQPHLPYHATEKTLDAPGPDLVPEGETSSSTGRWSKAADKAETSRLAGNTWSSKDTVANTLGDTISSGSSLLKQKIQAVVSEEYLEFRSIAKAMLIIVPFGVLVWFLRRGSPRHFRLRAVSDVGREWFRGDKPLLSHRRSMV